MEFFKRLIPTVFSAIEFHILRFWRLWVEVVLVVGIGIAILFYLLAWPPPSFVDAKISITQGSSAVKIARDLADAHVIAHTFPLWFLLRVSGGDSTVHAGTYRFEEPENVFVIAHRLTSGDYGLPSVRITFPEGSTPRDTAELVHIGFPTISEDSFRIQAKAYEGYLFPDTYFFSPSADSRSLIAAMRSNFETKVAPFMSDIIASQHSLSDIVIMASLLEKEARTSESRHIISGILWNRLEKGMPLQVDAVFGYINDRDTYSPSLADLKIDSPYNTYLHKGLPPGPIDNPGLDALDAALYPTPTEYLYYLTGSDDQMHYATTYAAHQANRKKYLSTK